MNSYTLIKPKKLQGIIIFFLSFWLPINEVVLPSTRTTPSGAFATALLAEFELAGLDFKTNINKFQYFRRLGHGSFMDSRQSFEKLKQLTKERISKFPLIGEFRWVHESMNGPHELDPLIDKVLDSVKPTSNLKTSVMSFSSELACIRLT